MPLVDPPGKHHADPVPVVVPACVQYQLAYDSPSPEQLKFHVYDEWSPPLLAAAKGPAAGAVGVFRSLQPATSSAVRNTVPAIRIVRMDPPGRLRSQ